MKKIELILIIAFSNLFFLKAQDYQTVYSDKIAYFDDQYGNVRCIRIDSVKYQTNSIYYPFSSIQQLDYDCYTPYGSSWIGKKIIIQDNRLNLFFNLNYDTIKIKTNALLNESWIAYELIDSVKIIAKVLKLDTLRFLEQTDSVKTIVFQVYDKTMTPVNSSLNNKSVLLSRNYGFIKILNFSLFPFHESPYPVKQTEQLNEYNLIGLSNPKLGIQNLTWFDVNNFNIGDELHVRYLYNRLSFEGGSYSLTKKTIYKYLDRKNYKDSIIYKIDKEESSVEIINTSDPLYTYYYDTITSKIITDTLFDKLPGESIIDGSRLYSNIMGIGFWVSKSRGYYFYYSHDSCWQFIMADGCLSTDYYYKGLGGPYYECESNFTEFTSISNELVYYKKGQESWGTPLVITNITDNKKTDPLVYPNPTDDVIWIKLNDLKEFTLFELVDINGIVVLKKQLENSNNTIKVNHITKGIYFFKILKNNNPIESGKIIIK
jgi:hypothetical protein